MRRRQTNLPEGHAHISVCYNSKINTKKQFTQLHFQNQTNLWMNLFQIITSKCLETPLLCQH